MFSNLILGMGSSESGPINNVWDTSIFNECVNENTAKNLTILYVDGSSVSTGNIFDQQANQIIYEWLLLQNGINNVTYVDASALIIETDETIIGFDTNGASCFTVTGRYGNNI